MYQSNNPSYQEFEKNNLYDKIEFYIQISQNISIPAIVFENNSKENLSFDYNDLVNFFQIFGNVIDFQLKGKSYIVLFNNFFSVNTCKEFLENKNNYIENINNEFRVRWFIYEKDCKFLSNETKNLYENIMNNNLYNLKKKMLINLNLEDKNNDNVNEVNILDSKNINKSSCLENNNLYFLNEYNINNQIQIQNPYFIQKTNIEMNNIPYKNYNILNNNIMDYNIKNQNNKESPKTIKLKNNKNIKEEKQTKNKFTCKYEILIKNDKHFQIAHRLIGNKGCNMKKIIEECKLISKNNSLIKNINDIIKLRLRGKGSGYKEGSHKKECNEPLHLCISSKDKNVLFKACYLVEELFEKIYHDYKEFCIKKGIKYLSKLYNKVYNGNIFEY